MNKTWLNVTAWGVAGGLLGTAAVVVLADPQAAAADSTATTVGLIGACLAALAAAFKAALAKRKAG